MNVQNPRPARSRDGEDSFQSFELTIAPFPERDFHVTALEGREEISSLYAFDVWFTCPDILDPARAAGQAVSVTLSTGGERFVVAGIVAQFDCDDPTPLGDFTYRVVIGPQFGLSDLSRQNQVYGTDTPITVEDIIAGKLTNSFSAASTSGGETQRIGFDLRLMSDYPRRDHVAQFEESDFAFLSRTCEHHGVFYFFEHAAAGETIVFADSNVAFREASGPSRVPFRQTRGQADDAAISSFRATAKPVTRTIYVRDYDDMQANTELLASHAVDQHGFGGIVEYGANFTSMTVGNRFAQVRAEEHASRRVVYHGVSTVPGLRPGTFFTLSGHLNSSLNGRYVVTSARHTAGDTLTRKGPYENSFEAIPFETPYRPQRKTPRPAVGGLFNATIDSAGAGTRADIDQHGRYRVRHMYDESHSAAGQASTYVRKAQPYAGKGDTGFHFPLLKDAEVVIGYLNGDPDRPIIVGAVPNSLTPAVSIQENHTSNRFRTPSGGLFELHDGRHAEAGGAGLAGTNTDQTDQDAYLRFVSIDTTAASADPTSTAYSNSSYLRLGAYVASTPAVPDTDEASLLPAAKVSSSTVTLELWDTSADYLTASLASSAAKGQLTSAQLQGTTATQNMQKAAVAATPVASKNNGIFLYSDQDLQVNTKGAAYLQFQSGHSTLVSGGDGAYAVPHGQFTLSAVNGVSITAGVVQANAVPAAGPVAAVPGVRATPEQIAAGNVVNNDGNVVTSANPWMIEPVAAALAKPATPAVTAVPADLYLIASNNINQKAYGPLSEITYGDSYKNVQGNTTDIFSGNYYKENHGTLTQHLYADTTNVYHQNTNTTTIGSSSTVFVGATNSIFQGAAFSCKMDIELNITIGLKFDMPVIGAVKIVGGMDLTVGLWTLKVVDIDYKMAGFDANMSTVKTHANYFKTNTGVVNATTHAVQSIASSVASKLGDLVASVVGIDSMITDMSIVL